MDAIALDTQPDRASPAPADTAWVSPAQLVGTLRRYWPLIAVAGVLCGAAAYAYAAFVLPKMYTASGTLAIEMRSYTIPALQGALTSDMTPDPMPMVLSEVQVLQSRALAQEVAQDLHLDRNPEFNGALRPPTFMAQQKAALARSLPHAIAQPLAAIGLLPDPAVAARPATPAEIEDGVVGALQQHLGIINDNRSLIIGLQFSAQDPAVAAAVVNSVIKHYMADKARSHDTANVQANSALGQQIVQVRQEMDTLEKRIADTRQKYKLVQTRAGSVGQQQLEDLSSALTRASGDRVQAEANYARAQALAQAGEVSQDSAQVLDSSTISMLRDREAEAARRVAELSTTLGSSNPRLRAAEAQLSSARGALASQARRVVTSMGAQAEAARQREAVLKQQLAEAEASAGTLSGVQSELQQLEKDADARRTVYQTLLQGEAETATASAKNGPEQTGARVVSAAVAPIQPSSPRTKVAGALGMLGGFAIGGMIALVRRREETGFEDAEAVTAGMGLTTLAVVRRLKGRGQLLASRVAADSHGPEAEALRSLRLRLRFAGRNAAPRSVLFVSSLAGEGSSSIAAAFARVAAMDGLRVLLIEGDLQKPSLSQVLGVGSSNGLIESLEGREHWREQVMRDPATPLELLLVASAQPANNQMMDAMQMQNLLVEAREDYNLIVMDGQPVTTATRSLMLAQIADSVVLVVEAGHTPRQAVREAISNVAVSARKQPVVTLNKAA